MGKATNWTDWGKLWLYVTVIGMGAWLLYSVYQHAEMSVYQEKEDRDEQTREQVEINTRDRIQLRDAWEPATVDRSQVKLAGP
jgi:hypothetical protein